MTVVFFLLKAHPALGNQYQGMSKWRRWVHLDWIGGILCLGGITSLLLALQWGGTIKPWNSATIVALFCVGAVVLLAFLLFEWHQKWHAILPLSLFARRTQTGASLEAVSRFKSP
jgi:Fungal trichothecene efflux pump (TRI12)